MALLALAVFAQNAANVTTKTQKIEVKDRPSAVMYLTKMDVRDWKIRLSFTLPMRKITIPIMKPTAKKLLWNLSPNIKELMFFQDLKLKI